ncbi:MAG TPA: SGNH/GDSL hydrolase family protein [Allosphingosinicella sp.]|jgi:lysophospholipase L1-like esterase
MRRLLVAAAAAASLGAAPPELTLPLNIGGRVIRDAAGALRFGWPGVYFESRFRGTAVRVRFETATEHLRLLVDGEEKAVFRRPGSVDLTVGGLAPGEHVVRLEKLTESQAGGGRFLGFTPGSGGAALQPPRRARQIEFIGDSYTVGYGNTSPRRECTPREVHATTDTQQAFGPLVARRFDADYRIVAYSGFGIVRNYGGRFPELSLPGIYERLKPDAPRPLLLPDPHWRPQLIVVNLGTNDFSTPLAPGERWRDAAALKADYRGRYAAFLRELDVRHSTARFVLMGSDVFLEDVRQVRASLPEPLRTRVTVLRLGELERTGCDWHPSLADHRRTAGELAAAIDAIPRLWTRR